jgi:uncharacterized membrane protein
MSTSADVVTVPPIAAADISAARASAAPAQAVAASRPRIAAIDVMRGLVMLFMLVDHVREAIYLHMQVGDPLNAATTSPALFFTRTLAHLCAPVFVFLTGLSAWLYANPASGPPRSPSGFLFKRGLLLVVLEVTVVNFAWSGDLPPHTLWLQVIWAIGLSMIALSVLVKLPRWAIATLGLTIVFGHNLLTPISFEPGSAGYSLWTILHERNFLVAEGPLKIKVTYPILTWIGVILVGYAMGPLYSRFVSSTDRVKALIVAGIGALALLAILRGFNIYGETLPWEHGQDFVHTAMSWLSFTKYPPSLDFLLLTLGISFLLMSWFETRDTRVTRAIVVFGGAPMFFYILHLYVLLIMQKVLVATFGANHGERWGVDSVVWVWVFAPVLAFVLYFPCRAFARFKRTSSQAWVRYF